MACAGARGETEREMAGALHLPSDQARVHASFTGLNRRLNGDVEARPYELSVANALWGAKGAAFKADFVKTVDTAYGGRLAELDFAQAPEASRTEINQWVEHETGQKIKDLLQPEAIQADTLLILTNAIYFKADWLAPFAEKWTQKSDFILTNGQVVAVPLMHRTSRFGYLEESDFQALEMRYAGEELGMLMMLPRQVDGLPALEKSLTGEKLSATLSRLSRQDVVVQMPRFKLTERLELSKLLSDLGMRLAFTRQADFSGMSEARDLFFSMVVHKAYIDVDEKGTEAAAATAVATRALAARRRKPPVFRADHPFLFLIRDISTGIILFMGRLMNPLL
jgi:serpin B